MCNYRKYISTVVIRYDRVAFVKYFCVDWKSVVYDVHFYVCTGCSLKKNCLIQSSTGFGTRHLIDRFIHRFKILNRVILVLPAKYNISSCFICSVENRVLKH